MNNLSKSIHLVMFFIIFSCGKLYDSRSKTSYLIHGDSAKKWDRIGINQTVYPKGLPSDCIIFSVDNTYERYIYYKNGRMEPVDYGDIIMPNHYEVISDSLIFLSTNYVGIRKLNKDTLVTVDLCDGSTSLYRAAINN